MLEINPSFSTASATDKPPTAHSSKVINHQVPNSSSLHPKTFTSTSTPPTPPSTSSKSSSSPIPFLPLPLLPHRAKIFPSSSTPTSPTPPSTSSSSSPSPIPFLPLPIPPHRAKSLKQNRLLDNIASTLSLDYWTSPPVALSIDPGLNVNHLCMHPDCERPDIVALNTRPDILVAARYQEIFIDLVCMRSALEAAHSRYVFDPRFSTMLSPSDSSFKTSLLEFIETMPPEAKESSAWLYFRRQMKGMGYDSKEHKEGVRMMEHLSKQRAPSPVTVNVNGNDNGNGNGGKGEESGSSSSFSSWRNSPTTVESFVSRLQTQSVPSPPHPSPSPSLFSPARSLTPGHVFITNTSVCELYCDTFLIPASISQSYLPSGTIMSQWSRHLKETDVNLFNQIFPTKTSKDLQKHSEGSGLVVSLSHWPWNSFVNDTSKARPFPIIGEVGYRPELMTRNQHIEALIATVTDFITVSLKTLREYQKKPMADKLKYLLAVPVIGTGGGQASDMTGDIIECLLELFVKRVSEEDDVDIVLVCVDSATYTHAQSLKCKMWKEDDTKFSSYQILPSEKQGQAKDLAVLASKGELSLFVGAGVSIGAGCPGWFDLLQLIEDKFTSSGWKCERKIGVKVNWDALLFADKLDEICESTEDRDGCKISLKQRVAVLVDRPFPSLLMSLLACLPTRGIITQNYDRLAERACQNVNLKKKESAQLFSVIPYLPIKGAKKWLLKMHGCVSCVNDIVITSSDFKKFETSKLALGGLLQANLLTSHMVFVGFSMTDPNYLRIMRQVREALRPSGSEDALDGLQGSENSIVFTNITASSSNNLSEFDSGNGNGGEGDDFGRETCVDEFGEIVDVFGEVVIIGGEGEGKGEDGEEDEDGEEIDDSEDEDFEFKGIDGIEMEMAM